MPCIRHEVKLFRLGSQAVGVLAELPRMGILTCDEEHRPRRDGLDVGEGVEVHEFHVAGQCGVRSRARRGPVGGELPARRTVKFVEFALDRRGFGRQFVYCAAGVKGFPAQEFGITLFGSLGDDPLALFGRQGVLQPVAAGCPHVVHADRCDGFQAGVDLRSADGEAAAAADPDNADTFPVDKGAGAEEIHRCAEVLRIDIRQDGIARFSVAFTPEGEVECQRDEPAFGQFRGVQTGALFLDCAHRVPDDDGGVFSPFLQLLGQEEPCAYFHFVLVGKGYFLGVYRIAFVEIVCIALCDGCIRAEYHKYGCCQN